MQKNVNPCLVIFLLISVAIFSTDAVDQKKSSSAMDTKSLVEEFRSVADIPGLSVAIGKKGSILWEQAFGFSDLESRTPAQEKTRFRLGSVSKVITLAAAMRLVEKGLLDLDLPISRYVPDLPEQYGKLTVRQLSGHLAGVRHYKQEDFQFDVKHHDTVKESLKIFTGDPLLHEPGSKYLYSTFGFVLLSAAMEGAAKKDFLTILDEEVRQPLKVESIGPDQMRSIIPGKSRYYERENGKLQHGRYEDPSYKWAAGGVISTAGDLVRFGMAHLASGYLQSKTLETMFRSQSASDGKETGVGLAWRIGTDWRGRKIYHHAGNISGGRAVLILYPESGMVISVLSNVSNQPIFVESTAQMIMEKFLPDGAADFGSNENPGGKWILKGIDRDKPFEATLELRREKAGYAGSISGAFPLLETAAKNGLPSKLHVASIWMKDERTPALILVSAFGILEMLLDRNADGFQFMMDEGPAKFSGEMRRTFTEDR